MAEQRSTTSKCVSVRIENLPLLVLEKIGSYVGLNDMVTLFNYQRPIFDFVAKNAIKIGCRQNTDAEHIRIYLAWNSETFNRVLDLLGSHIRKLTIIGDKSPGAPPLVGDIIDITKIQMVFERCPNIRSLRLRGLRTDLINFKHFHTFDQLSSIDFCESRLSIKSVNELVLPKITEFTARISEGTCKYCCIYTDISHSNFFHFLVKNNQLQRVTLKVILQNVCGCNFIKSKFIPTVKRIIARMRMKSFLICEDGNEEQRLLFRALERAHKPSM